MYFAETNIISFDIAGKVEMFCIWINKMQFAAISLIAHTRVYAHIHTYARAPDRSKPNEIPTSTSPKVRAHVYKINLLSDAIKYLSTGSARSGAVQRELVIRFVVLRSRRSRLCFCRRYRAVLLFYFFFPFFLLEIRAVAPNGRVCFVACSRWWFATLEWCMTGYWENANWKPISLKPWGMKACGASGDEFRRTWTVSRTFGTGENSVYSRDPRQSRKESLRVRCCWTDTG